MKSLKTNLSKIEKELNNIEFVLNLIPINEIYESETFISKCKNKRQKILCNFSKIELKEKLALVTAKKTYMQQQITYVQQRVAFQEQEKKSKGK